MKLLQCHIENFGKLNNCDMEFRVGFNCFLEENGWGKSTLAAFIRAMFYGFEGGKKRSLENERKKYRPWQGGVYGGSLTFETAGKEYVITRIFGEKDNSDEFELRDRATNMISDDFSSEIGEELFQINSESFMRSVFIGQNDCETCATDDINAKVGKLIDNTGDMNCFEKADERLKNILNDMSPTRKTGSIARRKGQLAEQELRVKKGYELPESITRYEQLLENERIGLKRIFCQMEENRGLQKELAEHQQRKTEQNDRSAKIKIAAHLKTEAVKREKELRELEKGFPCGIPTLPETDEMLRKATSIAVIEERLEAYVMPEHEQKRFKELDAYFSTADTGGAEKEAGFGKNRAEENSWIRIILFVAGLLAIAAGAMVFLLMSKAVGLAGGIAGIILTVISFFVKRQEGEARKRERLGLLQNSQAEYRILKGKNDSLQDLKSEKAVLQHEIGEYITGLGLKLEENYAGQLMEVRNRAAGYYGKLQVFEEAADALEEFCGANGIIAGDLGLNPSDDGIDGTQAGTCMKDCGKLFSVTESGKAVMDNENMLPDIREVSDNLIRLSEAADETRKRINGYERILEDLSGNYSEWEDACSELEKLKEQQAAEERKYRLLNITKAKLEQAKRSLVSKYVNPLLGSFAEYSGIITGENPDIYHMDPNISLTVDELGKQRSMANLSTGYRDLLGVCLRAAFADAMYDGEKPFLILDDSFVNLDDDKLAGAAELMRLLSQNYQVIYFTCSSSRCFQL